MHILDDPSELSGRAQAFLARVGERTETEHRPTEFMRVPDRDGGLVPAPFELVLRREGFAQKFGGLRYLLRLSAPFPDGPFLYERFWKFTLSDHARRHGSGWYFEWCGEQVSTPVRHLQHTDGRFGVTDGLPFIPVHLTTIHLIESHSLFDLYADWEPLPLHRQADAGAIAEELPLIAEASGPWARWYANDELAVYESLTWTSTEPRRWFRRMWRR